VPSSSLAQEGSGELAKRKINTGINRFIKESYGVSVKQLKTLEGNFLDSPNVSWELKIKR
jgi:hypothetical protein